MAAISPDFPAQTYRFKTVFFYASRRSGTTARLSGDIPYLYTTLSMYSVSNTGAVAKDMLFHARSSIAIEDGAAPGSYNAKSYN